MSTLRLSLPSPATGRLHAVDELKGVAIILVVLYHAGGVLGWNNFFHFDLGVDLFVVLSGVGLGFGAHYAGAGSFLARRLVRILPAYWLVLTLCWVGNVHLLHAAYTASNLWIHYAGLQSWFGDDCGFAINDSFWYISLILALYLCYCPCHALIDSPDWLLLVGAAISAFIAWVFVLSAPRFLGLTGHLALRVPGFFLGLIVGRLLKTGRIEIRWGPVLAFAVGLLVYVPYLFGTVFYTPVVALSIMGIYLFVSPLRGGQRGDSPLAPALKFLGDHSLEIFLIHQPLIREYNFYAYREWFHNGSPGVGLLLVGMAAGLALTLVLSAGFHGLLLKIPLPFSSPRVPGPAAP
jgi:peptidoglycan/LPS O-acetylase OafA/YrhL